MGDLYDNVSESRTALEKLAAKIPGVGGYLEREKRRHTDKIVRESIGNSFQEQLERLSEIQVTLVNEGAIEYVDDVERAVVKLRMFIDSVTTASYGYSGFFDTVKVNEEELEKIYEYDLAMLDGVDKLSSAIDNLNISIGGDGVAAAIRHVVTIAQEGVTAFDHRKDVLTGL